MGVVWLVVGLSPLIFGAWLAAKHGCRVEAGPPRTLASAVLAWGWVTGGVEILGSLGRLDRPTLVGWSVLGLSLAALLAWRRPAAPIPARLIGSGQTELGPAAWLATVLIVWVGLRIGLVSLLQPVKVVSDGPIYHLYMAARWWKAGQIFPVATPFGEVGATYFWANGELWYAWLMTLSGGDRFARIGQVPFLWLSGLAVESIARRLQVGPAAARLASVWLVAIVPLFLMAFEPNVDSLLTAGYAVAVFFFLRAFTRPEGVGWSDLILGSLAAGLGMGTKPTGIVFFPPLLVLAAGLVAWREPRRIASKCAAVLIPALILMGYWPARNAWLTGNPLYPLQVEVAGRIWLAGWFGPDAMSASLYYLPRAAWPSFVDIMLAVFDPRLVLVWIAAAMGGWTVGRPRFAAGREARLTFDRWVWGCAALAAFDLAAYWLVIPYRTQQRFAFPALVLFSVPLARLFDRAGWLRWVGLGLLLIHLVTPQPWPFATTEASIPWDLVPSVPNAVPALIDFPLSIATFLQEVGRPRFWATAASALGVLGAAWLLAVAARSRGRAASWRLYALAVVWVSGFAVGTSFALGGHLAIPFPFFRDYLPGWTELESRVGPRGARIAYAGNKIPYYLLGSKLQNDVRYINVDAHRDWLLHDYHRNAPNEGEPSTWPNPFPVWDRLKPDYAAWLANLRAERIDLLVVTRVVIEEGRENAADAERFPIERVWADAHPESFRPIYGQQGRDPRFKIYQVLPR